METKSQPTTFEIGGRKINLDKFVEILSDRDAFNRYYSTKKISNKDKEATWNFLNLLRKHLSEGTGGLKYVIDDLGREGFDNIVGLHNINKKGEVDRGPLAYATGYLLNRARDMETWKEPTPEADKTKIKWSNNAIATAINRDLFGRDSGGNIMDFIDLDLYDENERARLNTNRTARFKLSLLHIRDNWDTIFDGWTEDLKTTALLNINDVFTVFDNDGVITDNEYLDLSRITGMTNLRDMFTNEKNITRNTTNNQDRISLLGSSYQEIPYTSTSRNNKLRWIRSKYPSHERPLAEPISLNVPQTEVYGPDTQARILSGIRNASNSLLYNLIKDIVDGADLLTHPFIRNLSPSGQTIQVSPNYLLSNILQTLKNRGGLYSFEELDLGKYYIPETRTTDNIGIVWDSNANTLNEYSIHKIPYWVNKINQEWEAVQDNVEDYDYDEDLSMYKEGGIIKALNGTVMDRLGIQSRKNWLNIDNTNANATNTDTWDNYYNNVAIDQNVLNSILGVDSNGVQINGVWQTNGYLKDRNGRIITNDDGTTKYGLSGNQLGILLNKLELEGSRLSWNKTLNDTGYDTWNRLFDLTGFNEYFGGDSDRFNFMGPSTYNRHAFLNRLKNKYNSKENTINIDGNSIYWNGRMWLSVLPKNTTNPVSQIKIEPITQKPSEIIRNSIFNLRIGGQDPDDKGKELNWSAIGEGMFNITPDILELTNFWDSTRTNNRIAQTIDKSLVPILKLRKYWYSPITGDFSGMLSYFRQAANTKSLGARLANNTSDASLGAAVMLDANRNAMALEEQGRLLDDKEIKRTAVEHLARAEKSMEEGVDVANWNHAQRVQTERERAQNEATRLQYNYLNRSNLYKYFIDRAWNTILENKNTKEGLAILKGSNLTDNVGNVIYENYLTWLKSNPGKSLSDYYATPEGQRAYSWLEEANRMRTAMIASAKYGSRYNDPYNGVYEIDYNKNYRTE